MADRTYHRSRRYAYICQQQPRPPPQEALRSGGKSGGGSEDDADSFFATFLPALEACDPSRGDVVTISDSRYSNGGDLALASFIIDQLNSVSQH